MVAVAALFSLSWTAPLVPASAERGGHGLTRGAALQVSAGSMPYEVTTVALPEPVDRSLVAAQSPYVSTIKWTKASFRLGQFDPSSRQWRLLNEVPLWTEDVVYPVLSPDGSRLVLTDSCGGISIGCENLIVIQVLDAATGVPYAPERGVRTPGFTFNAWTDNVFTDSTGRWMYVVGSDDDTDRSALQVVDLTDPTQPVTGPRLQLPAAVDEDADQMLPQQIVTPNGATAILETVQGYLSITGVDRGAPELGQRFAHPSSYEPANYATSNEALFVPGYTISDSTTFQVLGYPGGQWTSWGPGLRSADAADAAGVVVSPDSRRLFMTMTGWGADQSPILRVVDIATQEWVDGPRAAGLRDLGVTSQGVGVATTGTAQVVAVPGTPPAKQPQSIAFEQPAPLSLAGGARMLTATATSGLPVSFVTSTPGVCTVNADQVTPVSVGSCSINAQQAGNQEFEAATEVARTVAVLPVERRAQTLSKKPSRKLAKGRALKLVKRTEQGQPVSWKPKTKRTCTVSRRVLKAKKRGACKLVATAKETELLLPYKRNYSVRIK